MNNRDFKKYLQAIAHGEVPEEQRKPPVKEPPLERQRPPQKEPPAKKLPVKSNNDVRGVSSA